MSNCFVPETPGQIVPLEPAPTDEVPRVAPAPTVGVFIPESSTEPPTVGASRLSVDVRPQSAFRRVGEGIALVCSVQSIPDGYIITSTRWTRRDDSGVSANLPAQARLATRNTFLSIGNLQEDDSGMYTCTVTAESIYGPLTGEASSTVEVGPAGRKTICPMHCGQNLTRLSTSGPVTISLEIPFLCKDFSRLL